MAQGKRQDAPAPVSRRAPIPANEDARLALLRTYRILDTAQDRRFDDLARLAASICGTPIALVSLVDEHRQWFKARLGLDAAETPREDAFCAHTILGDEVMVVADALADARFVENPLVQGDPHIRFYAGAPLLDASGLAVGTLCVIDRLPRPELSAQQSEMLTLLARQVVDQLRLNRSLSELEGIVESRERAVRALALSEARMHSLFHHAPIGTGFVSLDGNFEEANAALCELLGVAARELRGRPLMDFIHPDDREASSANVQLVASGSLPAWSAERRLLRGDGQCIFVQGIVAVVLEGEAPAGLVIQVQDLSERRSIQAKAMLTDRLASVGTLAAGVAHEINNPLTYVTANLELIAEEVRSLGGGSPSGRLRELLTMVNEARDGGERVRRIVRGLRTFSRLDGPNRVLLDLHEALDLAANMAGHEILRHARLIKAYGRPPLVWADEGQLGQVFLNLLVNAAQAFHERARGDNEIRVATWAAPDGSAVVEVRDTGPGIRPEVIARIFEPFFTTKPPGIGTGLGLAISYGIVHDLGGEITVENAPEGGAVFRVTLPLPPPDALERGAGKVPSVVLGPSARVLVVDDDSAVAATIGRVLREHDLVSVANGKQALRALDVGPSFDIILCDLMMPEMTGPELHAILRETRPYVASRMVFMSGASLTPVAREFLDAVSNERIDKPFDIHNLRALVRRFARSS